ncbi:hypothetical protein [Pseudomonas sp. PSE14]|uniref:hypothetical protein n=1 Tax=Pseudomonas sp. PSE14 TaxID=3016341 RepID=UPI0023D88E6D|nr:hypothetical protein [Pseudomonas sp. PSE14]WEJ70623.1 hypothetical protein O6P39_18385 [Pseudomonas sp. PSE14]
MGLSQPPYLPAILSLSLLLAGCSSSTTTPCDASMSGQRCHVERLLYRNDMLQAKLLIASGDLDNYELANALLDRAQPYDERGEVSFYKALLKIKEGPQVNEVLPLLEQAADAGQPYAVALLYKIWSEPYLVDAANPGKAQRYQRAYSGLDVARSGYPSFEQSLAVVDNLLAKPSALASQQVRR